MAAQLDYNTNHKSKYAILARLKCKIFVKNKHLLFQMHML